MQTKFLMLYPGVYLEEEKAAQRAYRDRIEQVNHRPALKIEDILAGNVPSGLPNIPSAQTVDPETLRAFTATYDPWNPLYRDAAYARAAGYDAIPAFPTFASPKGGFFGGLTAGFGDEKIVREHHHNCTYYAPVYAGDTLYTVVDNLDFMDITPDSGSIYRTYALRGTGKVYNQHGQLVMVQTCGVKECYKIYADPADRTWDARMEDINWSNHKFHVYTDDDWETIRALWAGERIRGTEPLDFDEITVGMELPKTVSGPYTTPEKAFLINGPSKNDLALREKWGEPGLSLTRDDFGMYHIPAVEAAEREARRQAMRAMAPRPPKPGEERRKPRVDNSPPAVRGRASMENYTGRDAGIRTITNWIGGSRLVKFGWCIGGEDQCAQGIPNHPNRVSGFRTVPGMEARQTEIHGEEGDTAVCRAVVTKKYMEDGKHYIGLTWWTETLEGQAFTEGTATVRVEQAL